MSNKKQLPNISQAEASSLGVVSLADRPNEGSRYGSGGLSAAELKKRFDALPNFIREKYNKIVDMLAGADAAKYITIGDAESPLGETLYDFLLLFGARGSGTNDKNISDYIETLYQEEGASESVSWSLKKIVDDLLCRIATASETIKEVNAKADSGQLDGFSPTISVINITGGYRLTITDKNGSKTLDILNGKDGIDGSTSVADYRITSSLNTTNYKLTISLTEKDGTVVNSTTVDFPIESVVVNGRYDSSSKSVVLTLTNGNTVSFSVSDLVSGLVNETTYNADKQSMQSAINNRYTKSESDSRYATSAQTSALSNRIAAVETALDGIDTLIGEGV